MKNNGSKQNEGENMQSTSMKKMIARLKILCPYEPDEVPRAHDITSHKLFETWESLPALLGYIERLEDVVNAARMVDMCPDITAGHGDSQRILDRLERSILKLDSEDFETGH